MAGGWRADAIQNPLVDGLENIQYEIKKSADHDDAAQRVHDNTLPYCIRPFGQKTRIESQKTCAGHQGDYTPHEIFLRMHEKWDTSLQSITVVI
jgi:hypothetical protein